jgi:hypothetical protein
MCGKTARAALLGAGVSSTQPRQTPRKPPVLSAPGRADDPADPALLYDQGFTIGGARLRLSGDEAKDDTTQYKQMIRQMIAELEDVLVVLKNNSGF